MIEINNLKFSYGNQPFTEIDSLTLHNGQLTALLGANGSGKTTLLKLIMGIERADAGSVSIDGQDLSTLSPKKRAALLSYFPQNRPTPDMTALQTVLLGRYHYGGGLTDGDRITAEGYMDRTDSQKFSQRNMNTLSYGERQRVYLAMTMAQETKNILFDEPSSFLDMKAVFFMLETMDELKKDNKCIFCVFHDIQNALTYADRLIIMKDGKIFDDGTPSEITSRGSIDKALGVHVSEAESDGKTVYLVRPI